MYVGVLVSFKRRISGIILFVLEMFFFLFLIFEVSIYSVFELIKCKFFGKFLERNLTSILIFILVVIDRFCVFFFLVMV